MSLPQGTPTPSVADFAGMPTEAAGPALGGLMGALGPVADEAAEVGSGALTGLRNAFSGPIHWGEQEIDQNLPQLAKQLAPASGYSSVAQPKVGGVLYDVLDKAAQNSGQGLPNTPGAARLLQHYSGLIR